MGEEGEGPNSHSLQAKPSSKTLTYILKIAEFTIAIYEHLLNIEHTSPLHTLLCEYFKKHTSHTKTFGYPGKRLYI